MAGHFQTKIVTRTELDRRIRAARAAGRTVVMCHGCFDIVHPGHIRHLEFARKHGDVLLVSITGDAAIDKDSDRPYIPEELRAENLAALEVVDLVTIDPQQTAVELLEAVRPDVYIKGAEYECTLDPRFKAEQRVVEAGGGRVVFSSGDVVFSSTELIRRIGRSAEIESRRLDYLCQRHDIGHRQLGALLARFSGRRVIVVGDVVIDRYVMCDAIDVAHEAPMMSLNQLAEHTYIGGAAIVARHLSQLGADVCLLTSLGRDRWTQAALAQAESDGIETCSVLDRQELVVKTRFLVEQNKLFKVETAERRPLDSQATRRAGAELLGRAEEAEAVVFCDFGYGVITPGLLAEVLPGLRAAVGVLAADVSGTRGSLLHFRDVDLMCPNERELRAAVHGFDDGLSGVAWEMLSATSARHLIATLGSRGLVAFDRPSQDRKSPEWASRLRSEYIQAMCERPRDVLGCGDALLAGATLALVAGANFIQAAYLGNLMAALEADELGNIPVRLDRLRAMLAARPELRAGDPRTRPRSITLESLTALSSDK